MFNTSDVDAFINELEASVEQIETNAIKAVEEYLKLVEQTSQGYVPIDSGDLRDSFFVEIKIERGNIVGIAGYDKTGALEHYAKIMHAGVWPANFWPENLSHLNSTEIDYKTDKQQTPRSHFLQRGFDENKPKLDKLLKGILDDL